VNLGPDLLTVSCSFRISSNVHVALSKDEILYSRNTQFPLGYRGTPLL